MSRSLAGRRSEYRVVKVRPR